MSNAPVQTITITASPPPFAFLSQPPASKQRISNWAARVTPGSPVPRSPRRSSFSTTRRRVSPSPITASFLTFIDTPTTAHTPTLTPTTPAIPFDLSAHGYAPVFIHFPSDKPSPPRKRTALSHFRSLSSLRFRPSPPSNPNPKPKPTMPPTLTVKPLPSFSFSKPSSSSKPSRSRSALASNKSRYAHTRPMPLHAELQLAQLMDGGSMDSHVKRVMAMQARAHTHSHGTERGAPAQGDVWRDGEGGIWWDQDEEWEYACLLDPSSPSPLSPTSNRKTGAQWVDCSTHGDTERRGSLSSSTSTTSSATSRYADEDDLAAFGGSGVLVRPGASVLGSSGGEKKPRRRPAALSIPQTSDYASAHRPSTAPYSTPSPIANAQSARADFLASSFAPVPIPLASPTSTGSATLGVVTNTGRLTIPRRFTLSAPGTPTMGTGTKKSGAGTGSGLVPPVPVPAPAAAASLGRGGVELRRTETVGDSGGKSGLGKGKGMKGVKGLFRAMGGRKD